MSPSGNIHHVRAGNQLEGEGRCVFLCVIVETFGRAVTKSGDVGRPWHNEVTFGQARDKSGDRGTTRVTTAWCQGNELAPLRPSRSAHSNSGRFRSASNRVVRRGETVLRREP